MLGVSLFFMSFDCDDVGGLAGRVLLEGGLVRRVPVSGGAHAHRLTGDGDPGGGS